MTSRKRRQILKETLEDLGGKANTNEIADKLGWNRNGVAQTLGSMGLYAFYETSKPTIWSIRYM